MNALFKVIEPSSMKYYYSGTKINQFHHNKNTFLKYLIRV